MAAWTFRIAEPGLEPRELRVRAGMTFGRNKANSYVLRDSTASSHHLVVVEDEAGLAFEDLGSTNGIRVKDGAILHEGARVRLVDGLKFWLGETEVEVRREPTAEAGERDTGAEDSQDSQKTLENVGPLRRDRAVPAAPPVPVPEAKAPPVEEKPTEEEVTLGGAFPMAFRVGPEALRPPPIAGDPGPGKETGEVTLSSRPPWAARGPGVGERAPARPPGESSSGRAAPSASPLEREVPAVTAPPPAPALPRSAPPPPATPAPPAPAPVAAGAPSAPAAASARPAPEPSVERTMDLSGSEEAAGPGLATLHPRLVIVLNEIRRIVPIDSSEFKVGRGKDIDLELLHPTISSHHSVIRFSGGKFTIEDAGSRNGTFVDRIQLRKGERSLLRPESYVRFAAAEAVFILDDPSAEEGGRSLQERAGEALVGERRITPLQLRLALEGAGDRGHIGERLLLETGLKVTDWIDAVRKASLPRRSASERLYLWCAVGALSLVILILLVVLLSG